MPLPANEVEALWTEFLAGSRWVDNVTGLELFDLCSDKTGMHLDWFEESIHHGEPFTWTVTTRTDVRWNTLVLVNVVDDPALNPPDEPLSIWLERDNGIFLMPTGADFIVDAGVTLFFDSPSCD